MTAAPPTPATSTGASTGPATSRLPPTTAATRSPSGLTAALLTAGLPDPSGPETGTLGSPRATQAPSCTAYPDGPPAGKPSGSYSGQLLRVCGLAAPGTCRSTPFTVRSMLGHLGQLAQRPHQLGRHPLTGLGGAVQRLGRQVDPGHALVHRHAVDGQRGARRHGRRHRGGEPRRRAEQHRPHERGRDPRLLHRDEHLVGHEPRPGRVQEVEVVRAEGPAHVERRQGQPGRRRGDPPLVVDEAQGEVGGQATWPGPRPRTPRGRRSGRPRAPGRRRCSPPGPR